MKERLIIAIVLILIGVTFAYLSTAFVLIEFNPFNWKESQRRLLVFLTFSISMLSFPISALIQLSDD